jgi:hypothetical protein
MIRNSIVKAFALSAFAFFVVAGVRANAQQAVSAHFNGGVGNTVEMQVVTTGSCVNGTASGSLHIQTLSGIFEGTYSSLSTRSTTKGTNSLSAVALGYYQPNAGGKMVATQVSVSMMTVSGSASMISVTMTNYYTQQVFYTSGPMNVILGYMTITVP